MPVGGFTREVHRVQRILLLMIHNGGIIDLPHDWSIEDLPGTNSPFNINAISQVNGGFTTGGTGWYRKSFTVPAESEG